MSQSHHACADLAPERGSWNNGGGRGWLHEEVCPGATAHALIWPQREAPEIIEEGEAGCVRDQREFCCQADLALTLMVVCLLALPVGSATNSVFIQGSPSQLFSKKAAF